MLVMTFTSDERFGLVDRDQLEMEGSNTASSVGICNAVTVRNKRLVSVVLV
jgi:hypothetical protein